MQGSGEIRLSQIKNLFGGPVNDVNMSAYYKGAGRVPDVPANSRVPKVNADGSRPPLRMTDFYGAVKQVERAFKVEWTTPGAYTWTVPANITSMHIVTIGGGGSGACSRQDQGYGAAGGGGGDVTFNSYTGAEIENYCAYSFQNLRRMSIFVGSGGAGQTHSDNSTIAKFGENGGQSSITLGNSMYLNQHLFVAGNGGYAGGVGNYYTGGSSGASKSGGVSGDNGAGGGGGAGGDGGSGSSVGGGGGGTGKRVRVVDKFGTVHIDGTYGGGGGGGARDNNIVGFGRDGGGSGMKRNAATNAGVNATGYGGGGGGSHVKTSGKGGDGYVAIVYTAMVTE